MKSNVLDIKEAFKLKWDFVPRSVIDDGGKRAKFIEVIRFIYMNGYKIIKDENASEESFVKYIQD